MKEQTVTGRYYRPHLLVVAVVVLAGFAGMTLLATGRSRATIDLTLNNNSQREIRHVYLAPVGNPNNWGPDQLNGSISSGSSYTLSNLACGGASIRVIAEDQNGCFSYNTVACDSNATWNITDSTTADCGG